jgi:hypothetical protein
VVWQDQKEKKKDNTKHEKQATEGVGTAAIVSLKGECRGVKDERRGDCSALGRWVSAHTRVFNLVGQS